MLGRHCTDQQLISFRDDALNPLLRGWVSWHLNSCWRCFSRMRDLGQVEEDLAATWRMAGPVPGVDAESARAEFCRWAASSGIQFQKPPANRWRPTGYRKAALAFSLGAVALIGGVAVWQIERPQANSPAPTVRPSPPVRERVAAPPVAVASSVHAVSDPAMVPVETATVSAHPTVENAGPSEEQLLQTELEAWWILHRAGACRGEPIEPGIAGHRVVVSGIAPSNARRAHLVKLLSESSGHQWLHIEIASPEDRALRAQPINSDATAPQQAPPLADHAAVTRAAITALRVAHPADDYDRARQRLVQITYVSIRQVEEALAETWAIRRLQERFANPAVHLAPQSRLLVEAMLREHLLTLQTTVTALGRTLNPVLSHMTLTSPSNPPPPAIFEAVDRVRTLVEAALAGNAEPFGAPEAIGGEIAGLCSHLSEQLSHPDDLAGRILPANQP